MAIPKNEVIWVTQMTEDGRVYHITSSKTDRSTYFLYETDDKTQKRIAKAKSPTDLKKHIKP